MQEKRTESNDDKLISGNKRRLLKGAAVAAPLLMTAASKPVMAGICTPSAWVSGNLSDHGQERSCGGRSPGYWKERPEMWPSFKYSPGDCKDDSHMGCKYYHSNGTKFHQNMGGAFAGSYFGDKTMMQVCHLGGSGDPYQLGAHFVAALLNAETIAGYGMPPEQVKEMYRQLVQYGEYTTSTGQTLGPEEMVRFIQNTFH